jgi:hypothetical protein
MESGNNLDFFMAITAALRGLSLMCAWAIGLDHTQDNLPVIR